MSVPSHQLGTTRLQMFADDEVVRSILALEQSSVLRPTEIRCRNGNYRGGSKRDRPLESSATFASRTPREKPIRYIAFPTGSGDAGTMGFSASPLIDRHPAT
jgi:hypothetical protein